MSYYGQRSPIPIASALSIHNIQFWSIPKSQQKLIATAAGIPVVLGDTFTGRIAPARRALQRPMAAFWPPVRVPKDGGGEENTKIGGDGFLSEEKKGCSRIQAGLFRLNPGGNLVLSRHDIPPKLFHLMDHHKDQDSLLESLSPLKTVWFPDVYPVSPARKSFCSKKSRLLQTKFRRNYTSHGYPTIGPNSSIIIHWLDSNVDHVLCDSVRFKCLPKILESCGKKNIHIYIYMYIYIHNHRNSPVRNAPIWFLLRDHPAKSAKKTSNLQDPLNEFCNGHVLLHRPWAKKNLPSCGRFDFSNAKQKSNGF